MHTSACCSNIVASSHKLHMYVGICQAMQLPDVPLCCAVTCYTCRKSRSYLGITRALVLSLLAFGTTGCIVFCFSNNPGIPHALQNLFIVATSSSASSAFQWVYMTQCKNDSCRMNVAVMKKACHGSFHSAHLWVSLLCVACLSKPGVLNFIYFSECLCLQKCGMAATIIGMLADVNLFWEYDNRETLMQRDKDEQGK